MRYDDDEHDGYSGRSVRVENDRWNQEVRYANDVAVGYLVVICVMVAVWALCFPSCASGAWDWVQDTGSEHQKNDPGAWW